MAQLMRDDSGMPVPISVQSRKAMFEAEPDLLMRGDWVCLNIEPTIAWPTRPQATDFDGQKVWIIPLTEEDFPGVAIRLGNGIDREGAEGLLHRFLSVMAWRESSGIAVAHRSGGSSPFMMGLTKRVGFAIRDAFDFTDFVCPADERARVALALIREARSLNHHGYAFLSYWRVLELAFEKKSAERIRWMENVLPTLTGPGVEEAKNSINLAAAADICAHLFASGRCAIAHANADPIINPDDPRDAMRLYRELPLVRELAVRTIEERFGIPTRSTELREHLYELHGWKKVLGSDLIKLVLDESDPAPDYKVDLPALDVRLRGYEPYPHLTNLIPISIERLGKILALRYATADRLSEIRFQLDFYEERLRFDIFNGIYSRDDGSIAAAEYHESAHRFFRDYMLNGELQIWESGANNRLTRLDAYLPLNMMLDLEECNIQIAAAADKLKRRRRDYGSLQA